MATMRARAEAVAAEALGFLAERPESFSRFMAMTGVDLETLRARAGEPDLLASVLDFLMSDEAEAEAFCLAHDLTPEAFMAVRAALPGGDAPSWT